MGKEKSSKFVSEKQYINKAAIICHLVICTILFLAYLVEVIKGSRTIGYFLIFAALDLIPGILEIVEYQRNKESNLIRHFMGFGYSILYVFAILTTHSITTFVYSIPMYVVITMFSDIKYCIAIVSGGFIANIISVVYTGMAVGYTKEQIPDVEIRLAVMLIVGLFVVIVAEAIQKVNRVKLDEIHDEKDKTAHLLSSVMKTSGSMVADIEQAADKMSRLEKSMDGMRISMQEVSDGNNETAESVQNQLERTGQIQSQIEKVKEAAIEINTRLHEAGEEVSGGIGKVNKLAAQAAESVKSNDLVVSRMEQLVENMTRMNDIVGMISSIANRTGMLALNASIESARAGEAGKGFAVVAQEITSLANQTKGATVDITVLIRDISGELKEVENAVEIVTESNRSHAETTKEVTGSFEKIAETTRDIDGQAKQMEEAVNKLAAANESIVASISNVSAATQEISGYASETYNACEENGKLAVEVFGIVQNLNDYAEELKNQEKLV